MSYKSKNVFVGSQSISKVNIDFLVHNFPGYCRYFNIGFEINNIVLDRFQNRNLFKPMSQEDIDKILLEMKMYESLL